MRESYTETASALIVRIEGELDQHRAQELRKEIDRRINMGCDNLIFDFSELEFMDSSGIGVIIGRYKSLLALGGSTAIAAAKPQVLRILSLAAIDRIIPLYDTVEEALIKPCGVRLPTAYTEEE